MLNLKSIKTVDESKFDSIFTKPLYDSYCFSNLPGTIKDLLGMKTDRRLPSDVLNSRESEQVVLLLIDGFGWKFWNKYKSKYSFLRRFQKEGVVSKLTTQFPSTTAPNITVIHTNQDVGESGVYEWFYYEPKVDRIIAPLLFSIAGDKERNTLKSIIDPKELYPNKTIYQELTNNNIRSFIFQNKDYTPSPYSDVVFTGATEILPYRSLAHGLTLLAQKINSTKETKAYYYYYYSLLDSAGHNDGTKSDVYRAEIQSLFSSLEELFYKIIKNKKDITILLSADHGMADIDPKKTFYLNIEIPEIVKFMRHNKNGDPIVPAGSCRDMFLHIEDDKLDYVKSLLEKVLFKKARVYKTQELLNQGFFNIPSKNLIERLGNLVIFSYGVDTVWWYEKGRFEQNYYGQHGGLTSEEMEIPLLSLSIK